MAAGERNAGVNVKGVSRTDPVFDRGPTWSQFDDFVEATRPTKDGGRRSDIGGGAQLADLIAMQTPGARLAAFNPMAQDTYGNGVPLDPFAEAADYRAAKIAEREAAGVPASGPIDWGAVLYDMNAPYRAREEEAGGAPFAGAVDWSGIGAAMFGGAGTDESDYAQFLAKAGLPPDFDPGAVGPSSRGGQRRPATVDPVTGYAIDPVTNTAYRPGSTQMAMNDRLPQGEQGMPDPTALPGQTTNPFIGLKQGIEAEQRRLAGISDVAMPRPRPGYVGAPIETAMLPGQVEGGPMPTPEADAGVAAFAPPPKKEPTIWDNVVDMGGGLLEHTGLGGAVKALFPDVWYGAGEALKGAKGGKTDNSLPPKSLSEPIRDRSDNNGSKTPRPTTPAPFPDLNNNGIDDRLEGYTPPPPGTPTNQYGRPGSVLFPDMPPYNPGRDNEWLYFRRNALAEGGEVDPMASDPRMAMIADVEDVLEDIAAGKKPGPEDERILREFVAQFGDDALRALNDRVKGGNKMRGPRLVEGPGTETSDSIPAVIEDAPGGPQPAALSDGEVVIPADAVRAAGDGDRQKGAEQLMALSDMLVEGR